MRTDNAKELAEHCFRYVTPVCNANHHDRLSVLSELLKLIQVELNVAAASEPDRVIARSLPLSGALITIALMGLFTY